MGIRDNKPELMVPAGDITSFHAALEGGADAVYLGLKQFNARSRAVNFTLRQLQALVKEAHMTDIRVYVTLNTAIRNEELSRLLDILYLLRQIQVNALIIQDWGIFHIIKCHFPELNVHASTQMANHNSLGAVFSERAGFDRVIFARELTAREIAAIRQKSGIETEIFVHGALCYSFSGMCLFSSYLGGMGANRGLCTQPCRRVFQTAGGGKYLFSLKDHELIDYIPMIMEMGIHALKIEGRMKNAEYVYQTTKAYRTAIDHPDNLSEAKKLLADDMGREKTGYFFSGSVKESITDNPGTGSYLGDIKRLNEDSFSFQTSRPIQLGNRLRIHSPQGEMRRAFKVKDFTIDNSGWFNIITDIEGLSVGDSIFLANTRQQKFNNTLDTESTKPLNHISKSEAIQILSSIRMAGTQSKEAVFVRIDSIQWLKKTHFGSIDGLILNLSMREWTGLKTNAPLLMKNQDKIFIELPKFIGEKYISIFRTLCENLYTQGYTRFVISHLSQKLIIPDGAMVCANENVLAFNDAAAVFVQNQNIAWHTYPLENDLDNLLKGSDRSGMVPLYFYPELFYSRMPVHIEEGNGLKDDQGFDFRREQKDGVTIIVPERPVSLFQYKKQLIKAGFRRFLIDFSHESPSSNRFQTILNRCKSGSQVQPSTVFNFKRTFR